MKCRNRVKTYRVRSAGWHAGLLPVWNGLITSGKERHPRLIKTLKLMDYVYIFAEVGEEFAYGTAYWVGDGFLLRKYSDGSTTNEDFKTIAFIKPEYVVGFDLHKYVGRKNVYYDDTDKRHFDLALSVVAVKDWKFAQRFYDRYIAKNPCYTKFGSRSGSYGV